MQESNEGPGFLYKVYNHPLPPSLDRPLLHLKSPSRLNEHRGKRTRPLHPTCFHKPREVLSKSTARMGSRPSRHSDPGDDLSSCSEERAYLTRSQTLPSRTTTRRTHHHHHRRRASSPTAILQQVLEGSGPSPQLRRFLSAPNSHPQHASHDGRRAQIIHTEHRYLNTNQARHRRCRANRRSTHIRIDGRTYRLSDDAAVVEDYVHARDMRRARSPALRGLQPGDTYLDRPDSTGYRPPRVYDPTRDLDPSSYGRPLSSQWRFYDNEPETTRSYRYSQAQQPRADRHFNEEDGPAPSFSPQWPPA